VQAEVEREQEAEREAELLRARELEAERSRTRQVDHIQLPIGHKLRNVLPQRAPHTFLTGSIS
jgi:hypothetical protein